MTIGARRLSIIDVAAGHQPLSNEDGTVWAVLNGEIYNHPELQRNLRERGHRLGSDTDTEVLVHLYEEHGDALVHALEGMFAFAIWDARRRRLLLARDRFGEKPLFYREAADEIRFASELTALLAPDHTRPNLDPASVASFYVLGYVPGPGSIVEAVRQLPPASTMVWAPDERHSGPQRYWIPPAEYPADPPDTREVAREAESTLRRAVRGRMLADVPLGVFLSGGLDSTLVSAIAAEESSEPIQTFSVGYDIGSVNEVDAAAATAAVLSTDHHTLILSEEGFADDVSNLLTAMDQPIADPALIAMAALSRFAKQRVTVAVGGEGADELFGGYPRYRWLARAAALDDHLGLGVRGAAARAMDSYGGRRASRLATVVGGSGLLERHLEWVTGGRLGIASEVLGPRARGVESSLASSRRALPDSGSVAGRFMRMDQQLWLVDDVLAKADRASMLASLEVRTPFLHPNLAELAAQLPGSAHASAAGKTILRRILPRPLRSASLRRKRGFEVPIAEWLRGSLRELLLGASASATLYDEGWLDRGAVSALVRDHLEHGRDRSAALWPIVCLASWQGGPVARQPSG